MRNQLCFSHCLLLWPLQGCSASIPSSIRPGAHLSCCGTVSLSAWTLLVPFPFWAQRSMFWHIPLNSFGQAWREEWSCSAVLQCPGTRGSRWGPAGSPTLGFASRFNSPFCSALESVCCWGMLTACSPGLPGTWWTSVLLGWFVTGHWGLHSLLVVCRRLFFHLMTSLWIPWFGCGFSAEGFTLVPGYKNCSHQAQGCVFPSALPWTQKIQCQGTEKAIILNPQSSSSSCILPWPVPATLCKSRIGVTGCEWLAEGTGSMRHKGTFLWNSQHEI